MVRVVSVFQAGLSLPSHLPVGEPEMEGRWWNFPESGSEWDRAAAGVRAVWSRDGRYSAGGFSRNKHIVVLAHSGFRVGWIPYVICFPVWKPEVMMCLFSVWAPNIHLYSPFSSWRCVFHDRWRFAAQKILSCHPQDSVWLSVPSVLLYACLARGCH